MANQEQLEILKQGAEAWNTWRREKPIWAPDLIDADLSGVNLSGGVRLDRAKLSGAKLIEANLNAAELRNANLDKANLNRANLKSAHLMEADFSQSFLGQANLGGARLHRANFTEVQAYEVNLSGTELSEANLSNAHLSKANLGGANLREANLRGAYLIKADLSDAYLAGANLNGVHLDEANLQRAYLMKAYLIKANLSEANLGKANLEGAHLMEADLRKANLRGANLRKVHLKKANLTEVDLREANLSGADLRNAVLCQASIVFAAVDGTNVSGSSVHGINVWDLVGEFEEQKDLVITPPGAPIITVDNVKVAQFIYLILNNEEIRDVLNTLTSKSVLILGRFALPERKAILDALRSKLREYNLLPIVFDFDRPIDKDFTETIKTLAGLSYFVIADVTNPKSSPLELQATVPDYQIPFVPIIQEGESPFAMMVDLQKKYNWVLKAVTYDSIETLIKVLKPLIIDPAMKKRQELRIIKAQEPEVISAKDYLEKGKS